MYVAGARTPPLASHSQAAEATAALEHAFARRRPGLTTSNRVTSWSDPFSAQDEETGGGGRRHRELGDHHHPYNKYLPHHLHQAEPSGLSRQVPIHIHYTDSEGDALSGEDTGMGSAGEQVQQHTLGIRLEKEAKARRRRRRKSFHALSEWRKPPNHVSVLDVDRMRIDVELCAQLLVMRRRERDLPLLASCLSALLTFVQSNNDALRSNQQERLQDLREELDRAQVLARLEADKIKADTLAQETDALVYSSAQFNPHALWSTVRPSRRAVLAVRERVTGTGGRRLPSGVLGAHGRYSRLQRALDGSPRLVDALGRTESEAEEEDEAMLADDEEEIVALEKEELGEGVQPVENRRIKPMWLLRFFQIGWGAGWFTRASAGSTTFATPAPQEKEKEAKKEEGVVNGVEWKGGLRERYTNGKVKTEEEGYIKQEPLDDRYLLATKE